MSLPVQQVEDIISVRSFSLHVLLCVLFLFDWRQTDGVANCQGGVAVKLKNVPWSKHTETQSAH